MRSVRLVASVAWPLTVVASVHSDCMGCGLSHEDQTSQGEGFIRSRQHVRHRLARISHTTDGLPA